MLDRIELRQRQDGGDEIRIVADFRAAGARLDVTIGGKRTKHDVDRHHVEMLIGHLREAAIFPVPDHVPEGERIGYEVILSAGMTQSVFRWVGATPATWEPVARTADELLALGRRISSEHHSV
jgi:hypothetical protein